MIHFADQRPSTARALLPAAVACLVFAGCALRPHALDYVVLEGEEGQPPSREALVHAARAAADDTAADTWPIYDEPEVLASEDGTGGSGCSVGLIGSQCERGLLEDVAPLEEQSFLGEDGKVIDARQPLHNPSAGVQPTTQQRIDDGVASEARLNRQGEGMKPAGVEGVQRRRE